MNKNKKATIRVKYFTKPLLQLAVEVPLLSVPGRHLDLDAINAIPDAQYPVELNLLHHHRHGEPAETHMRAMVVMNDKDGIAIVDMPLEFWERLPEAVVRVPKATARRLRSQ